MRGAPASLRSTPLARRLCSPTSDSRRFSIASAIMGTVDVDQFLRDRGASEEEIADAETKGLLALLVVDKLVFPGSAEYDEAALVGDIGVDPLVARQLWRAMGFPAVPPGEVVF